MSKLTAGIVIGCSVLSLCASVTTLGVAYFGVKRMEEEVEVTKRKANAQINKLKAAIVAVEI